MSTSTRLRACCHPGPVQRSLGAGNGGESAAPRCGDGQLEDSQRYSWPRTMKRPTGLPREAPTSQMLEEVNKTAWPPANDSPGERRGQGAARGGRKTSSSPSQPEASAGKPTLLWEPNVLPVWEAPGF